MLAMVNLTGRNCQVVESPEQCYLEPTGPQPRHFKTPELQWFYKTTFGKPHYPDLLSVSISCYIVKIPHWCTKHRLNDNNEVSDMPSCPKTM